MTICRSVWSFFPALVEGRRRKATAPLIVRQQFKQKERDYETGLGSFGAPYRASTQGRFTGADDFLNDTASG